MNKQEIEKAIDDLDDLKNCESISSSHFKEVHGKNLELAISALTQQLNNGWIPCSERLPDNKVDVLITKESGTVKIGFCNVNYNEWREDGYLICPPIAWQNLPERYKEEN